MGVAIKRQSNGWGVMQYRKFGNADIKVSDLGFGRMRFPTHGNEANIDEPVSIRERAKPGTHDDILCPIFHLFGFSCVAIFARTPMGVGLIGGRTVNGMISSGDLPVLWQINCII